ncbi:hypothetical protein ANCDUO_13283 [Ancylostoma duodenale]|uniref:Uncharacterized protein n=1 Tax=Ancylostoma duodenale TaxID=51022 RepID=A0A0C2D391_9BILA|nr:hypothetical protein ANCDUO_13283 [Ancylostoma duodenale]
MESALTKYRSALVSHVKSSHPELDHEAVMTRILALLGALPYLECVQVRKISKCLKKWLPAARGPASM